jgi:hypothetical protein
MTRTGALTAHLGMFVDRSEVKHVGIVVTFDAVDKEL